MDHHWSFFKIFLVVIVSAWMSLYLIEAPAEIIIRSTIPGTNLPDIEPGLVIDDGVIYETIPGTRTFRNYEEPGYIETAPGEWHESVEGTDFPDYFEPGFIVE